MSSAVRERTDQRPAVPIDPRIRARRIQVRRHEGRRRLQRLADVAVLVMVALAFLAALWTPLLDVDRLEIAGTSQLDPATVAARSGVERGQPLIGVDVTTVGRRVAALPWVAEVRVDRGLDGTVALHVTERTAVAQLGAGPDALLVDQDGRVLGPPPAAAVEPLVELDGIDQPPAPGGFLDASSRGVLALAAQIDRAVPGQVASLHVGELTGVLRQGGEVRFGDASHLDAKVRSLSTVLEQVDLTCLEVLDLRLPGSPVLTREEGCS